MLASVGLACLKHANVLADMDWTLPLNDFFHMVSKPRQLVLCQDADRSDIRHQRLCFRHNQRIGIAVESDNGKPLGEFRSTVLKIETRVPAPVTDGVRCGPVLRAEEVDMRD
jgi:hypothetical protein